MRFNPMTSKELKARTKAFARRSVKLVGRLPRDRAAQVIGKQILPSATSAGANYRAARQASLARTSPPNLLLRSREQTRLLAVVTK